MKFSIIGTGFIMPRHIEAINFVGGEIIDIINDAYGQDKWQEMIKNTKADCIVILTPNDLHFKMCQTAAEAGKVVLCEKPLAIKSEHIKDLAKYKNIFTVLQLRHHPLVQAIKSKIKNKKNHQIEIDISVYRDTKYYQSWKGQEKRSGGVLFNLGIHYHVSVFEGVTIKDDVFIGPGVVFTNVKKPKSTRPAKKYLKTIVKKGASIGANATILPGIIIHEAAMIGAGAVVTKDVPKNTIVVGNPARRLEK